MKIVRDHIDKVKSEGDELAWIMMISFFNRHYTQCFEDRKSVVRNLKQKLPRGVNEVDEIHQLGKELIDHQAERIPDLEKVARDHEKLLKYYLEMDALKMKKRQLTNRLKAEREKLIQELRLEVRRG